MAQSLTTSQLILVYVRDVFLPLQHPSDTCMDHVLGNMSEKSCCGVSFGIVWTTTLDFADDAVIFAAASEILAGAFDSLGEKAEPLRLRASWIKTKVQAFDDILDVMEVTQTFTYLGSLIHSSTSCELGGNRRLGRAWSASSSQDAGV